MNSQPEFNKPAGNECPLPINFFTIVLDGEPYIRYHLSVFKSLNVPWHWHIVEGVANLVHDTGWSVGDGGRIPQDKLATGLSTDGTTEYLDAIERDNPGRVTVYRKPRGEFWEGKIEMVCAPLAAIEEHSLLWQIDSDELWTAEQIQTMHSMFVAQPNRYAAWFWCHYFVGPDRLIATRNCYAQDPEQLWLRVWRYQPGMNWVVHEPPVLSTMTTDGRACNVGLIEPFTHSETEAAGLVFQHMSYTTESQVRFKEEYYGYKGALSNWRKLQASTRSYELLRDYFPWVSDSTLVESANRRGIVPLMRPPHTLIVEVSDLSKAMLGGYPGRKPRIAIDGVFFQLNSTGIARLWRAVLENWAAAGYADEVLLLDRAGTMPVIPGFRYRTIPPYRIGQGDEDRAMLQQILDEEEISLFASTYYTTPTHAKTIQLVFDMIPEVLGYDIQNEPAWIEKHYAFARADFYLCISNNTRRDLHKYFPDIPATMSDVVYPGIDRELFHRPDSQAIVEFKQRYQINQPYFLMVGFGGGYKNGRMLLDALDQLPSNGGFQVVLSTGSGIPNELASAHSAGKLRVVQLSDDDLRAAYSGAVAFVYPSLYEGFGLPILEAMALECPVITTSVASMPEVAGNAAIYADDRDALAEALCDVQKPEVRRALVEAGLDRVSNFSWRDMAEAVWKRVKKLSDEDVSDPRSLAAVSYARQLLS